MSDAKKADSGARGKRARPFLFVVVTLVVWWAIGTAGYVVVACIPGGGRACPLWDSGVGSTSADVSLVPPAEASAASGNQATSAEQTSAPTPAQTSDQTQAAAPSQTAVQPQTSTNKEAPPTEESDDEASEEWSWWPSITKHDWLVFFSLLTALWVAKVAVYPYEDEPAAN